MQLTEAATLDRKSGEADLSRRAVEGSAVPRTPRGNVFRPDRSVVERSAVSFFVLTHTLSLLRPYGRTQSRAQQSVKSFLLSLPSSGCGRLKGCPLLEVYSSGKERRTSGARVFSYDQFSREDSADRAWMSRKIHPTAAQPQETPGSTQHG